MIFVSDLHKSYGDKQVIKGISFSLSSKGLVGFLGVNGAGKTTTLRMLTGFLSPSRGCIQVNGFDVRKSSIEARQSIGYLPEQTPLYLHMRVEEFLSMRAQIKRPAASYRDVVQMVQRVADYCSLMSHLSSRICHLSKGYRQRVGLADALLWLPSVLVLDEPTVGLDPHQLVEVRELIQSLAQDHLVLFSSHNLAEVQEICDSVLILHEGRLCAKGTPDELENRLVQRKISIDLILPSESHFQSFLDSINQWDVHVEAHKTTDVDHLICSVDLSLENRDVLGICRQLSKLCIKEGYVLTRLLPRRLSLEEIFLSLTSSVQQENLEKKEVHH